MILLRRKEVDEEHSVKLVAYTIILFISSFFAPFVIVASYQSMVYFSRSYWFFSTPFSAYITFMGGMLFIAAIMTIYLIFRQRENARKLKWITGILLLISIPVFILSLTNYYYMDDKGIYYNGLTGIEEKEYKWNDMAKVHIIYRNHQGSTGFYQYKFEMTDGSKIILPFNDKLSENKFRIEAKIKELKIPVHNNFKNPIVD
ncbi:hypothetical protein BABA_21001 [Neobacillus bataviensis LMG 21833]|uniref:Uncharacterized protein n=1 Tax=Neobacillus bataviensis LMG 21833 TaxID=1117379 RepID=K6DAG3_9BACI|nr:hypothetical protein [Neobacillus bataviensis]EKN65314.1 hypothetical protein BABA_21001 [Neobacillus bataviensis LMG 21833]